MEENQTGEASNNRSNIIRFAIIAAILGALLLGGLFVLKQTMMNNETSQKAPTPTTDSKEKTAEKKQDEKATLSESSDQTAATQDNEEAALEDKPVQNEASTSSNQSKAEEEASPAPQAVANTGPSGTIPSTGPVEIISGLVALAAVSYGGVVFARSRRELATSFKQ